MSSVVIEKQKKHHKLTPRQMQILVAIARLIQEIGGIKGLADAFGADRGTFYKHLEGKNNV